MADHANDDRDPDEAGRLGCPIRLLSDKVRARETSAPIGQIAPGSFND